MCSYVTKFIIKINLAIVILTFKWQVPNRSVYGVVSPGLERKYLAGQGTHYFSRLGGINEYTFSNWSRNPDDLGSSAMLNPLS